MFRPRFISAVGVFGFVSREMFSMCEMSAAGCYLGSEGLWDTGWICHTGPWSGRRAPAAWSRCTRPSHSSSTGDISENWPAVKIFSGFGDTCFWVLFWEITIDDEYLRKSPEEQTNVWQSWNWSVTRVGFKTLGISLEKKNKDKTRTDQNALRWETNLSATDLQRRLQCGILQPHLLLLRRRERARSAARLFSCHSQVVSPNTLAHWVDRGTVGVNYHSGGLMQSANNHNSQNLNVDSSQFPYCPAGAGGGYLWQ